MGGKEDVGGVTRTGRHKRRVRECHGLSGIGVRDRDVLGCIENELESVMDCAADGLRGAEIRVRDRDGLGGVVKGLESAMSSLT